MLVITKKPIMTGLDLNQTRKEQGEIFLCLTKLNLDLDNPLITVTLKIRDLKYLHLSC